MYACVLYLLDDTTLLL